MTTFTENLNNAKPAQDKYFFEGGGARKASNALLAALMLGFSPAIAADNSVAVTNSSPLAGEARWGVNSSETLTPIPSPRGRGEISTLTSNPSAGGAGEVVMLASADGSDLFSLNQVQEKGEHTITKFQYNDATGAFEPVFYKVEFTKTDLGHPDVADAVHYFKYTSTDGSLGVSEGTADDYDVSYSVDNNRVTNSSILFPENNSDIDQDFINSKNYIQNAGENNINSITGDFVGNSNQNLIINGQGHDRNTHIGSIKGNFINNSSTAIKNIGKIDSVEGNFIGNTATVFNNGAYGNIKKIKGNFIGNSNGVIDQYSSYATGPDGFGATTIGSISGNFIGNSLQTAYTATGSNYGTVAGGVISNGNKIGNTYDIDNNLTLFLEKNNAVIYQKATMTNSETGESFTGYTALNSENVHLTAEQLGEYIASGGKVIRLAMTYKADSAEFEENKEIFEEYISGGYASTTPADIPTGNILTTDDIITNATAPIHDSLFIGNHVKSVSTNAQGGAIYNNGLIGYKVTVDLTEEEKNSFVDIDFDKLVEEVQSIPSIQNSSFYNNYAESESGEAKGGAIYSSTDITIGANNGESIFSGNKVINNGVEESNAIYMGNRVEGRESYQIYASPTLTLSAKNNGLLYFNDKIDGTTSSGGVYKYVEQPDGSIEQIWVTENTTDYYKVKLTGDGTGTIVLNNDVKNAEITLENTNLYLGKDDAFDLSHSLSLDSGTLSMINGTAGTMHLPEFNLRGDVDMMVDVDLANKTMDRITAD